MRLTARPAWLLGGSGALLLAAGGTWALVHPRPSASANRPALHAVLPRPVTVEVLNSTRAAGVARVGRALLRRAGLDVVYFGNPDRPLGNREHNEVLVRRGDTTGVGRVLEALGQATVIDAPDSARLVDLTILLGADFLRAHPAPRP
jgi:hypothetical protein